MDLKEIQLIGFKSFADKTVIRFEEGVTCIVGPNGCGKSNVADAVRWVLGEQSAKNLRGGNMQDVIFGGTDLRKPLSYCEVTLVFDNSNHIFNLDCTDVAMSRRLYRTGESKYLINGQPSRLKDIVALFHSIGLGKEGYSIIGQGKVQQIMNSKPEDRRLIFEEATGLMVFKSRKQEIERKIEDSQDNLYIFRQRIDEAERRLGPLGKQAEAAKEYHEYSESLKVNEANTYIYRYENAETEKEKFKKDIVGYSDKIIALNVKTERINQTYDENRAKISKADGELSDLNDKRVELSVGNERKDGELKLAKERINTYRSQISAAAEFLDGAKDRIGEIGDELARGDKFRKEGEGKRLVMENEKDVLRSAISSLNNKIEVFERLSDENLQNQRSEAENLAKMTEKKGTIAARKEAYEEKISELKTAKGKSEERKDRLQTELDEVRADKKKILKFTSGGNDEIAEKTDEMREMQLTVNDFKQELFSANGQLASLRDSLEVYISLKNRYEGYKDSVRRLLSIAKTNPDVGHKVKGALADILRTEQKYEVAIETALGGAMQNVVTANSDDARYLIEYLKKTNGGIVTFLPVSSMRPKPDTREIQRALSERGAVGLATELVSYDDYYYNVVSNLLGNTLICDTIYNANVIAKKYGNYFKIVTLDGDIVLTSGAMTGGSRHKDGSSLLSGERKIQECKENIAKKQKLIQKLEAAIADAEKQRIRAEKEVDELREKYQSANSELAAIEQRERALAQQLTEAESDIEIYAEALKEFESKLHALKMEEEAAGKSEEELRNLRAGAEEEMASQRSQCDKYKEERDQKSKRLHDLEMEYTSLTSAIERSEEDERRLSAEKDDLVKRILETEDEKKSAEEKLKLLEEEAQEKELTEEEQRAVQEILDKIAEISKTKEELNAKQIELEEERNALQEELTKQSDKRYKCEIEISKIDTNLENMRQRMEEAYALDYEGCLAFKVENFDVGEAANLISALKRKITMLGNVNPNAVEEFAEEKAHYDDMVTQRDDLQKAIDDLTEALNEIRGEMLKLFDQGFDEINENFKVTFKELFGGGKAELQLDYQEGEDPLAAGVEIVACPPGKKLTKISLLSGGEQALTAIAILFAILKARPMPFCILDEIEAALDEANVDRFASYLKRFSEDTQFIVITHRKPTMNQADSLFGVTMQEKGVSKIVSVKLSEVESKLGEGTVE